MQTGDEKCNKPTLYLHIGLHKTGTTFLQNIFSQNREYLLQHEGLLYPEIFNNPSPQITTRPGANSGHSIFTQRRSNAAAIQDLITQCETLKPKAVFLSSENFTLWKRRVSAQQYLERFSYFDDIKIILLLRRQDRWIESYYKQLLDGYIDFEIRSIDTFCEDLGDILFDYKSRFTPWRDAVGSANMRVGSYDDIKQSQGVIAWFCDQLNLSKKTTTHLSNQKPAGYDSINGLDSFALRLLNRLAIPNKNIRTEIVKKVCAAGRAEKFTLLPYSRAKLIKENWQDHNKWIAENWFQSEAPQFSDWADIHGTDAPFPDDDNETLQAKLSALAGAIEEHRGSAERALAFQGLDTVLGRLDSKNTPITQLNAMLHLRRKIQARLANSNKKYLLQNILRAARLKLARVFERLRR